MRILLILIITFLVPFECCAAQLDLPQDSEGWTIFTPSTDSRIMYVSADGNDATGKIYSSIDFTDPFKPSGELAFATYAAAYANTRSGYPDWILVRRGDTFVESPAWDIRSGRSATEPFLIASYGSNGDMPVFKCGSSRGMRAYYLQWFAVSGIEFYAHTRNPGDPEYLGNDGFAGFNVYIGGTDPDEYIQGILIEGCKFRFFTGGIVAQTSTATNNVSGLTVRRTVVLDSYSDTSHAQGMYSSRFDDVLLEENIFDHNGWYSQAGAGSVGKATLFSHNTYFTNSTNVVFKNNIFMRGASMGNKFTAQSGYHSAGPITLSNNLYVDNEIGISVGGNTEDVDYRFYDITVTNNVFTRGGESEQTDRNISWNLEVKDNDNAEISDNYILHNKNANVTNSIGLKISNSQKNSNIHNNIVYGINGWAVEVQHKTFTVDNLKVYNNIFQEASGNYTLYNHGTHQGTYSDNIYYSSDTEPIRLDGSTISWEAYQTATDDNSIFKEYSFLNVTRDVDTYMGSIGETATVNNFITSVRSMGRYSWDTRFTANAVNSWIKQGFGPSSFLIIDRIRQIK